MQVVGAAQDKKGQEHWLFMQLKPDASRAYKIDNRNKTGKEVKVGLCTPAHTTEVFCMQLARALWKLEDCNGALH